MATWVRSGTGTSPSALDKNGPIEGAVSLDNATAPALFDPAGVTSVRFQWRLNISTGLSNDTWDDHMAVRYSTPGGDGAGVDDANAGHTTSGAYDKDQTDNAPSTGLSTANWEAGELLDNDGADIGWADVSKSGAWDGTTGSIPVANVTVTITYTEAAAGQDMTPGLASLGGVTAFAPTVVLGPAPQDTTPGLATSLVSGFEPTVVPGAVAITAALVVSLVVAFTPTVSQVGPSQGTTPALATSIVSAFDPTVTVGAVDIAPPLASSLVTSFAPIVAELATTTIAEVALEAAEDPLNSTHRLKVRLRGVPAGGTALVSLYEGGTLRASYTPTVGTSWAQHSYSLSTGEADSITDYTDLRVRIEESPLSSTGWLQASWIELDLAGGRAG